MEDIVIETLTGFPDNIVAFKGHDHVTKNDYDTVLIPEVEKRLQQHEKLGIYYEFAPDFAGIEPGAALEDAKVGFSHLRSWDRIAVVTDVEWIKQTMKFFGFLMPAKVRTFPIAEAGEARAWVAQSQ